MFGRDAPGFDELEIDWGPASPFGPNDDPGTPMTHQDSSESDELRPDLFEPGAAPLPAPEPVVTPAANAQPERPIAPFVRTLYALLEGPYDETLCEWSENGRRIVFPDPTQFAETVCPQAFRHSKWSSFSRMLNIYDFRKVSSTPRSGAAPARAGLAPMVFEHDSFRRGGQGELYLVQRRKRKKPEDGQRDADREAEVASLRSRVTELERRLSQLEAENSY